MASENDELYESEGVVSIKPQIVRFLDETNFDSFYQQLWVLIIKQFSISLILLFLQSSNPVIQSLFSKKFSHHEVTKKIIRKYQRMASKRPKISVKPIVSVPENASFVEDYQATYVPINVKRFFVTCFCCDG